MPVGNLTSQLWGNFYLDELDHWVTENQRHGAYLRYTDDFLLFGDDKARLRELRAGVAGQLARVRLKLAEPKVTAVGHEGRRTILRVLLPARGASAHPGRDEAAVRGAPLRFGPAP